MDGNLNHTNGTKSDDVIVDEDLFDKNILNKLDWSESSSLFNPEISPTDPGENFIVRPLSTSDYEKGFLNTLSNLTFVGKVTKEDFLDAFHKMKACNGLYYVTVIEDTLTHQVVASTTLYIEQKFIHSCALKGRIEDVVVDNDYRGKQLGKLMVEIAKQLAKHLGCYKISLDCKDTMIKFYDQLGFRKEEGNANSLALRIRH